MEKTEAASIIEAILFVSGDPVDSRAIAQALLITEDEVGAALDELTDRCDIGMGGLGIHRLGQTVSRPLKQREYMARGLPFFYAVNDPNMPEDESMCRRLPDDETIPDGAEILRFAKESRLDAELPARMRAYAREHLGWEQQFKPVLERLGIPWNETSSI